ncbi:hypothetical protein [Carboxylicivirga linearis]|uniref:Uncharacterized protein n=1 Tax=Carboxylicivirga linearis TaxID=1628157 RepID=A0ABS5K220_9BACT|nr:hypothetical protein [Carboxylicivirga linearis]MBS2101197.1 hypothetical protein [Carboxylicivirga linearis]
MSVYGKERLYNDLISDDYSVEYLTDSKGMDYVAITEYEIQFGIFKGQGIALAIPVPKDYPRTAGASIHVKSNPHLLDCKDTIAGKRNIINSNLGNEWRYWSFRFNLSAENPTKDLMSQINGIFKNI